MNNNIKIANELVRIAESLRDAGRYDDSYVEQTSEVKRLHDIFTPLREEENMLKGIKISLDNEIKGFNNTKKALEKEIALLKKEKDPVVKESKAGELQEKINNLELLKQTIEKRKAEYVDAKAKYEAKKEEANAAGDLWHKSVKVQNEIKSGNKEIEQKMEEAAEQGKKYILYKKEGNLWRILACTDFSYSRDTGTYKVTAGDLGGLIESEKNLSHTKNCWVADNAKVYGNAFVYGHASVYDDAEVYGNARVFEYAKIYGGAKVRGDAQVYVKAKVYDGAVVEGDAWVYGESKVHGHDVVVTENVLNKEVTNDKPLDNELLDDEDF